WRAVPHALPPQVPLTAHSYERGLATRPRPDERRIQVSTVTSSKEVLQSGTWQADTAHSRLEFAVDYLTGTFRGTFSPFDATLEVDEGGSATLHGSTSAASIKVQDENLSGHLQSPEFFDGHRTPH